MINLLRWGVLLLCASAGWAVDWTAYKPEGYVSDFAKVIDPASRTQLEQYCGMVERSTHVQMALVMVPSLGGEPIQDVAYAMARAWGVGRKGENDGVLLLLAIQDRRSRLEVGTGLESVLPGSLSSDILTEMRPTLRQQRYGQALMAAAETIGQTVAKVRNVKLEEKLPRQVEHHLSDWLPWPVLIGGAALLFWLLTSGSPRGYGGWGGGGFLPWLILGNMMGRSSWGGRSSGGFGGYDSGDSFGGFGGGDFGGGGASGDW